MRNIFFILLVFGLITSLIPKCECAPPYLDLVQTLSTLKVCEENLDQFSWQTLFQKGKFYKNIALLNAKVQQEYLQLILKDVNNDNVPKNANKKKVFVEKIQYYLGLALYVQKNWNAACYAFKNSGSSPLAECMKAACLKKLNNETEYKNSLSLLPGFYQQLCILRVNFEKPFQTKITVSPINQLGHIESLVWKSCQESHLNDINENTILKDNDVVEKIDNTYRVSVYNPLNFYYLSAILLQESKKMIDNEILLLKKEHNLKYNVTDSIQIKHYFQKYYCLADALIYFQKYKNALLIINNLRKQMNNKPLIKDYLSLIYVKCLWEMGQKDSARDLLTQLQSKNNTLLIQISMMKMKYAPEDLRKNLNTIKEKYHPLHCDIPHSQHWGTSCNESCIPWYHAVGQGYILQGDNQTAMLYYMEGFNALETVNQLSCYSLDYLTNLLKLEIEFKKIVDILEFILNGSTIDHVFPEIRQLRLALGMIQQFQKP